MVLKNWQKVLVATACGGAIYGLGCAASIWSAYAVPLNALSGVVASTCVIFTGFSKSA